MTTRRELANAIRALSMDAVQRANSGHPGAPMGMADIAEVLWRDFLKHNPGNPLWLDRDRFVLSNGHASMLLYSLLYLTGLSAEARGAQALPPARLAHRRPPGARAGRRHRDHHRARSGQGLANAVGMALAEKMLAAQFNRPGFDVVDHHTYVFLGDGCLMEGISHEACSLAGTLGLGKLIAFYDDNGISIDGKVQGWFTDDTPKRFEAYGWHVIPHVDGHDAEAVAAAIRAARRKPRGRRSSAARPSSAGARPNKQGTKNVHGEALGADEVAAARKQLGWTSEPFVIPEPLLEEWNRREQGAAAEASWRELFSRYRAGASGSRA